MPRSTQHASSASLMIFKKTFLIMRLEKQHGKLLVSHAFGYITASGDGLSEPELEDLISLDDQVLQDIYQYWLPPIRRIPPLLWWTRIRTDISDFLRSRQQWQFGYLSSAIWAQPRTKRWQFQRKRPNTFISCWSACSVLLGPPVLAAVSRALVPKRNQQGF